MFGRKKIKILEKEIDELNEECVFWLNLCLDEQQKTIILKKEYDELLEKFNDRI